MNTSSPSAPAVHLRSNFSCLYWDIFWYGVLAGSTMAFLNVYAARLGATGLQIGLLTAGPAVANLIISLPAARWLEQRSLIRTTFLSSVWQRAGYLPLILLPWVLSASGQVWALELIILVMSVPGTLLAISFNAMFAEIVPPEWRGHVVGRRNALLALYLLFYTFQYVPLPIFPLAWVRELHLSDGEISLGNALFYLSMLPASMIVGPISAHLGHRRVLVLGALFYGSYPKFIGLAQNATLFWVASLVGGVAWALANAGLVNRLMERVPAGDVPAHMALHNLALNLGILGGSLIGPALGDAMGLRVALWIGAGLRLLSGLLLGLWG